MYVFVNDKPNAPELNIFMFDKQNYGRGAIRGEQGKDFKDSFIKREGGR